MFAFSGSKIIQKKDKILWNSDILKSRDEYKVLTYFFLTIHFSGAADATESEKYFWRNTNIIIQIYYSNLE